MGSKGLFFKIEQQLWTLAFVLGLLGMAGLFPWQKEEMVIETGVCQIAQHLNKTSVLLYQHLPHEFGFNGSRQPNLQF